MADNVVRLDDKRPHLSGEAKCIGCNHTWSALAPVGTVCLECPECGTMKGAWIGLSAPDEYWQCQCENDLFFVSRDGCMCARCGEVQQFN